MPQNRPAHPEPQATPAQDNRSQGIDALRAFLSLWVLFVHVIPWAYTIQGSKTLPPFLYEANVWLIRLFQPTGETNPAVLAFIVLSGYCIHRSNSRLTAEQVKPYAIRRFFRIAPIYLLAIVVGVVGFTLAYSLAPDSAQMLSGTRHISAGALAAKLAGLSTLFPPLNQSTFQGNAPLHTVMAEGWLYLAYPLLLLGVERAFGTRALWLTLLGSWLLGILTVSLVPDWKSWWHNGSLLGFLLYWWMGAKGVDSSLPDWCRRYLGWIGALWLSLSVPLVLKWADWLWLVEIRKVLFALVILAIIVALDKSRHSLWGKVAPVGVAGYSIYALHAPIAYTLIIAGLPWWISLSLPVIAGMLAFRFIEDPLTNLGKHWARQARPDSRGERETLSSLSTETVDVPGR